MLIKSPWDGATSLLGLPSPIWSSCGRVGVQRVFESHASDSLWYLQARNLKFYPLSLRKAMEGELSLIADIFKASTCDGTEKLLKDFNSWELLNMNPADILDIPVRLCDSTGVSLSFLENSIKPYLIPAIGKDELEKDFKIATPAVYFASATIDYSWQKGAGTIYRRPSLFKHELISMW